MRKFLIFVLLSCLPIFIQAKEFKVNEYMNDLYFANGIDTKRKQARIILNDIIKFNIEIKRVKSLMHTL